MNYSGRFNAFILRAEVYWKPLRPIKQLRESPIWSLIIRNTSWV